MGKEEDKRGVSIELCLATLGWKNAGMLKHNTGNILNPDFDISAIDKTSDPTLGQVKKNDLKLSHFHLSKQG